MNHWATKYIGKPFKLGARGPVAYDCWGLMREIYQTEFNIQLPDHPGVTEETLGFQSRVLLEDMSTAWVPSPEPFDGCGVAMSHKIIFHHVGVYLDVDGGKVLHAWEGTGVIASSYRDLRLARGMKNIKYYRHKLWPT